MKKLYAALLALALAGHTYAKPIDVTTAKAAGYSFLTRNTNVTLSGANDLQPAYTATAVINGVTTPCYYVFNTTNGFVMVSADDNVKPILGYSDESVFVTTNIPTHVQWWLNGYTQQISYVIKNNLTAEEGITAEWKALNTASSSAPLAKTTDVSPLLTTLTWDQNPYYNTLCPGTGTGAQRSVTGCVATAMAQVMKFWNWPAVGSGYNSYIPDSVASYGAQTANFGATAYQWSSMPVKLTGSTTSTQNSAVATLMYHCGVAVDMNYNIAANDGSGAYVERLQSSRPNCAEFALKSYFKYSPTLHGDSRTQYATTAAWVAALKADLDAGRPVLYTGQGSDGGHCWVADGYQTSGTLFHFNWGWSGLSNGYFTVDNLAPSALGTGGGAGNFNSNQGAIFGIKPKTITANAGNMKLDGPISVPSTYTSYIQQFTLAANIVNNTGSAFTGQVTAEIFDLNENLVTTLPAVNASIANNAASGVLTFTPSTENVWRMVPGIYIVRIYYKTTAGSWTIVGDNANYINYATTAVSDESGLFLYDSLACTEGRVLQIGQPVKMTTTVGNLTGADYNGTIDASIWDPATQQAVFDIQQLTNTSINDGSAAQLTFTSANTLNIPAGTYVLMTGNVTSQGFSPLGALYYSNPITVVVPAKTEVSNVNAIGDVQVYPNPATDVIKVDMQGVAASTISLLDIAGRMISMVTPASTMVTIPVQNFAPGVYLLQVQTANGMITKKITVTK